MSPDPLGLPESASVLDAARAMADANIARSSSSTPATLFEA
jgi:hypothetical protein